jgi:hypothetical protein
MDYIANLIHYVITGDFSVDRYRDFIRTALDRILPYEAPKMPSECHNVDDCINEFNSRVVLYDDRLARADPTDLNQAPYFNSYFDSDKIMMRLCSLVPMDISNSNVLRIVDDHQRGIRDPMYTHAITSHTALQATLSFPTLAGHLLENTKNLERLVAEIRRDEQYLESQYFLYDYNVIERKPCSYYFRSARQAFLAALPQDRRRLEQRLNDYIPGALARVDEYDRCIQFRQKETQAINVFEETALKQEINNVMQCLHANWDARVYSPESTTLKKHCCVMQFEDKRALRLLMQFFVEASKSILSRCYEACDEHIVTTNTSEAAVGSNLDSQSEDQEMEESYVPQQDPRFNSPSYVTAMGSSLDSLDAHVMKTENYEI